MRKEYDDSLVNNYPNLYKDRFISMQNTSMCWGFECGDGWFSIINNLSQKLEKLILEIPKLSIREVFSICNFLQAIKFLFLWSIQRVLKTNFRFVEYISTELNIRQHYRASQVKEKFGSLRFYMNYSTPEMDKLIDEAEKESALTCEECGKSGKPRSKGKGWLYTACNEHINKQDIFLYNENN